MTLIYPGQCRVVTRRNFETLVSKTAARKGPGDLGRHGRNLGSIRRPLPPQGRSSNGGQGGERWQPLVSLTGFGATFNGLVPRGCVCGGVRGGRVNSLSCFCRSRVTTGPLASLQCRHATRRLFTGWTAMAFANRESPRGVWRVA